MMALSKSSVRLIYNRNLDQYERARRRLEEIVRLVLEDVAPGHGIRPVPLVESSVKNFESFYAKALRLEARGRVAKASDCLAEIGDFARARIICQTIDDADRIRRLMIERNDVLYTNATVEVHAPGSGLPSTGYRAIHLDLEVDAIVDGHYLATPCELQVVTALQYAWGLYTHKDFYKGTGVPPLVAEVMRELSDLLNVADKLAGRLLQEVETSALGHDPHNTMARTRDYATS
jgi:ppGpp synthetase/RelA/SpoT-type nucleotidyltranferase